LCLKQGYDVFNALDLMGNDSFLKELKFGVGDGNLHYYLYNFKCPEMSQNKVGASVTGCGVQQGGCQCCGV